MNNIIHYTEEEAEHLYFTSDLHFNHENILKFCNRPFNNVEEMNEFLIAAYNETIDDDSIVWILGDLGFNRLHRHIQQLKGHKHLILGNHDGKLSARTLSLFESVDYFQRLDINGQEVILQHYPLLTYAGLYREQSVWQLFGHIHSKIIDEELKCGKDTERAKLLLPYQADVGIDRNDMYPYSWSEIKAKIEAQIVAYHSLNI